MGEGKNGKFSERLDLILHFNNSLAMLSYAVLVSEKETGQRVEVRFFLKSYTSGRAKMPLRSNAPRFQPCALPAKGSSLKHD